MATKYTEVIWYYFIFLSCTWTQLCHCVT